MDRPTPRPSTAIHTHHVGPAWRWRNEQGAFSFAQLTIQVWLGVVSSLKLLIVIILIEVNWALSKLLRCCYCATGGFLMTAEEWFPELIAMLHSTDISGIWVMQCEFGFLAFWESQQSWVLSCKEKFLRRKWFAVGLCLRVLGREANI